jgi:hypothetical protein
MKNTRQITLAITVTVPLDTEGLAVENAINTALDEPPCDWGEWIVGAATIIEIDETPV